MLRLLGVSLFVIFLCSCSTQQQGSSHSKVVDDLIKDPLTEDETVEVLDQSAQNWFYGNGLGDTAFKIGTSVLFPPVALVWLADVGMQATGTGSVSLKAVLPEDTSDTIIENYQAVVSVPGKVTSLVAGKEFRDQERGEAIIRNVLNSHENPKDLSDV